MSKHADDLIQILRDNCERVYTGAEIGVMQGDTSAELLKAFPNLNLRMVDLWKDHPEGSDYWNSGDQCSRISSDSQAANALRAMEATRFAEKRRHIMRKGSLEAAKLVADSSLDFAFIDADHTYEAVNADLYAWYPKVCVGGVICGHDYGHPRDRRGVWGVSRAVDQFFAYTGLEVRSGPSTVWWVSKQVC